MRQINWTLVKAKLRDAVFTLPAFFKNPVQGMRQLPDWDWPTMLILQGAFAAACSLLSNLVAPGTFGLAMILRVISGILVAPIASLLIVAIASGFFYYTFFFFFQREIPYRQIYLHVVFAAIPSWLVSTIAPLIPPALLIGAAASLMLLYVGFSGNFHVERRKLRQLLGGLMALYLVFWVLQIVRTTSRQEHLRIKATPESLDILEKELNMGH